MREGSGDVARVRSFVSWASERSDLMKWSNQGCCPLSLDSHCCLTCARYKPVVVRAVRSATESWPRTVRHVDRTFGSCEVLVVDDYQPGRQIAWSVPRGTVGAGRRVRGLRGVGFPARAS